MPSVVSRTFLAGKVTEGTCASKRCCGAHGPIWSFSSRASTLGYFWVCLAVVARAMAAVLAKKAGLTSYGSGWSAILTNPWYIAELFTLALQAGVWWLALRQLPLSRAFPPLSLSLPLTLMSAHVLFGEPLRAPHILGVSLVVVGVLLSGPEAKVSE